MIWQTFHNASDKVDRGTARKVCNAVSVSCGFSSELKCPPATVEYRHKKFRQCFRLRRRCRLAARAGLLQKGNDPAAGITAQLAEFVGQMPVFRAAVDRSQHHRTPASGVRPAEQFHIAVQQIAEGFANRKVAVQPARGQAAFVPELPVDSGTKQVFFVPKRIVQTGPVHAGCLAQVVQRGAFVTIAPEQMHSVVKRVCPLYFLKSIAIHVRMAKCCRRCGIERVTAMRT